LELWRAAGLDEAAARHVEVSGAQGWSDRQMASGRVLLNLTGGEGLDDLNEFEADSARRSRWLRPCASAARTSRQPISLFNQDQRGSSLF